MGKYPYCAHVHGLFDDVVIVMKIKSRGIHRLIEGPGVRLVLP